MVKVENKVSSNGKKYFSIDLHGEKYDLQFELSKYYDNGNVAILLQETPETLMDSCFGTLSLNLGSLPDVSKEYFLAVLDTNNIPVAEEIITKTGVGKPYNEMTLRSGFCEYPVYIIDKAKIREYIQADELHILS